MRVLVSAETSGPSRRALETVITETPARAAMSFRRIICSERCAAPMQFEPQGFAERAACQLHQPNRLPAAPYRNRVAGGKFGHQLPVGAEDCLRARTDNLHFEGGRQREN